MEAGCDTNIINQGMRNVMHMATQTERTDVVEALLGHGANVHLRGGPHSETPLHIAARIEEGEKRGISGRQPY